MPASPPIPWEERFVSQVAAAMKRARGRRSARELSKETDRIGYHRSMQVIGKLNSVGRDLRVAEFLVFAAILDVPPALLLFDGYPDGVVEYLPGREATSKQAIDWFSGTSRLPTGPDGEPTRGNTGTDLVAAVARRSEMTSKFIDLAAMVCDAGDVAEDFAAERREQLITELAGLTVQINDLKSILEGRTPRDATN
jgi:hypothetical protein